MPHIVSIACTPSDIERKPRDRYGRVAARTAALVPDHGFDGDLKSRGGKRQLNIMRAEEVEELRLDGYHAAPGELGEQLVVGGLAPTVFRVGARLRLGSDAVIELTTSREPCGRFAHIQSKTEDEAYGRLGFMARVVRGGAIEVGAAVHEEHATHDDDARQKHDLSAAGGA